MTADQITIAITVYNRRDYLFQAIQSALDQVGPARVMVVEDAGPDPGLPVWVKARFGDRVQYHRNARRRGLFDNWNACLERCSTPWLSILHDDDFLEPGFVTTMLELAAAAPDRGLYLGQVMKVDAAGRSLGWGTQGFPESWRAVDVTALAQTNTLLFPGQLMRVENVRSLGGFRAQSLFCGDWEMWFKLSFYCGAAQSRNGVASFRIHSGWERGTNAVLRSGRKYALDFVQCKRNLALLKTRQPKALFDRRRWLAESPMSALYLLHQSAGFSRRMLQYNVGLLLLSRPMNWRYALFQNVARRLGPGAVRMLAAGWRAGQRLSRLQDSRRIGLSDPLLHP